MSDWESEYGWQGDLLNDRRAAKQEHLDRRKALTTICDDQLLALYRDCGGVSRQKLLNEMVERLFEERVAVKQASAFSAVAR